MALIFFLSSQPSLPIPKGLIGDLMSYTTHFVLYGVLAVLFYRSLINTDSPRLRNLYSIALSAVYAITDETHQAFVPNRNTSLSDLAVDVLGSLVFLGLIHFINSKVHTSKIKR